MSFDGALLNRGFWLYVWEITSPAGRFLYVGRTGDSSSANAASPFNRIGQHLDFRSHAKGNSLTKRLRQVGVEPSECRFEMVAVGPLFPEQDDFESHKPVRDTVYALESALAMRLKERGYRVIGTHGCRSVPDGELYERLLDWVDTTFPHQPDVPSP